MVTVDEYIAEFNGEIKARLQVIRDTIKSVALNAIEKISWRMPTFLCNGILIQFAAFKNHISIFPGPAAIEKFAAELKNYKTSKGTIQFSNSDPLPIELIKSITKYKLAQNEAAKK